MMAGANKKKPLIAIVGFLVIMLMLTVLSRAAASFAVVEVKVMTVSSQTISEVINTTVVAQVRQEVAVRCEPEQTIETIFVSAGDKVNQSDALFKVRLDDLEASISSLEKTRHLVELRIGILNEQINEARAAAEANTADAQGSSEQAPSGEVSSSASSMGELNYQLTSALFEREELDRRIGELYYLRGTGGVVSAPVGGVVSDVVSRVGDITSQGAVLLIADGSAGSNLVFSVESETAARLSSDTIFSVTNVTTEEKIEEIEFVSVSQNPLNPKLMDVTLHVPAEGASVGATLNVKTTISSETYGHCLPLAALHQTSGGAYVFVVEDEHTALGTEQMALSVNVEVVASDDRWAAVEGLGKEQQVIVEAAKTLTDKDRVLVFR